MTTMTRLAAATAALGSIAAPAAAQYYSQPTYPQQYQQTYPQQYQQTYPQQYQQTYPGYGYNQNPVTAIIDQLLGNQYNVTDRQAVSQCASAAMAQAQAQYGGYGYNNAYGGQYGQRYGQYANGASNLRVTAITDVQRRTNGLRVTGLMSSGYGGQYGYQNNGYAAQQLRFRCNVDYRGAVTNIRINANNGYRRY
jgi:hypothetical protein